MELTKRKITKNQLIDYASLFSSGVSSEISNGDLSLLRSKIKRYDCDWFSKKNATYLQYIKHVYSVLQENHKNEYIYKNEFLNQWLLKEIAESDASLFNEFRVGNSVADLVMFNGKSKVFEIKSNLDTNKRLELQIKDYQNAFNETYVIVPSDKLEQYSSFSKEIGIITFHQNNQFQLVRKASLNKEICKQTVMNILHTNEYKSLVELHYGELPAMNSFNMYDVCFEYIKRIPSEQLNRYFIDLIKKRKHNTKLSQRYFKELNQLFLAQKWDDFQKKSYIHQINQPID